MDPEVGRFVAGEVEMEEVLWEDINNIEVDEFTGKTFAALPNDQRELFDAVVEELKTARIVDDPNLDDDANIDRLLQLAEVLRLALNHKDNQREELRNDRDRLQTELDEREDSDPVQLLEMEKELRAKVRRLEKDNKEVKLKNDEKDNTISRLNEELKQAQSRANELAEDLGKKSNEITGKEKEIKYMQTELDEMDSNRAGSEGAQKDYMKLLQENKRLERRIDRYSKTEKDFLNEISALKTKNKKLIEDNGKDKDKLEELYDMESSWKLLESELESQVEDLTEEREQLKAKVEDISAELEEKLVLLDEFEDRFNRQFTSWTQEKEAMEAQIEALEKGSGSGGIEPGGSSRPPGSGPYPKWPHGEGGDSEVVAALREELNVMRENEVLYLEAYEQLEKDLAKEIDAAVEEKARQVEEARGKLSVTEEELRAQYEEVNQLREQLETLQNRAEEAEADIEKFLSGNYGLAEAVRDAKLFKQQIRADDKELLQKVDDINNYASKMEELLEENAYLKRKAGLPEDITIDLSDLRLARHGQMMQIRAMNKLLEEENMRLEEDVRRMKHELRFRTKWEGLSAAGLGLTPEQLQLLELKAEQIKYGQVDSRDEEFLRLQKRIQYLEGRLAEAQGYADLPPHMREVDDDTVMHGSPSRRPQAISEQLLRSHRALLDAALEAIETVSDSLDILPPRHTDVFDMLGKSLQALKAAVEMGKKAQEGAGDAPLTPGPRGGETGPTADFTRSQQPVHIMMSDVLADAQADKLREKLKEMAGQLAELQGIAAHKNGLLEAMEREKAELVRRLRVGGGGAGDADADMVTREEFDELQGEADSLKMQLIECLEEQSLKEREIGAMHKDMEKYRHKFQEFEDQKRLLYREYVREWKQWRAEKESMEGKLKKLEVECAESKAATEEYKRGMDTVQRGTAEDVRAQYADAVRRMALASMRSAKLARELECSVAAEKHLMQEKRELEDEIADMGSTLRTRMRYLERSKQLSDRRIERIYRELDVSVPCKAYEMLVEKHGALQRLARTRLEESAETVMREEEVLNLRDETADLTKQIFEMIDEAAQLKEQKRQLERKVQGGGAGGSGQSGSSHPDDVAELVKLRVEESNAKKRAELAAKREDRALQNETEIKARLNEVEKQLTDSASELHSVMERSKLYQQRVEGGLSQEEAARVMEQLDAQKKAAMDAEAELAEVKQRARELEERTVGDKRNKMLQLATITQLRTALREIGSSTDVKASLAKLHEEVNHVRSKEACVRSQLIRSEQERGKLQDENSSLRRQLNGRDASIASLQDNSHFAVREKHELMVQLQAATVGRVETWRAERWRRKLSDVKGRNDVLAGELEVSRQRLIRLEAKAERAELELEAVTGLEEILARPMAEAYRQAAHLTEQALHQRLDNSKVRRELSLQTEKVRYLEAVNAELEARLEEYEAEAFRNQSALEADKVEMIAKNRDLEQRMRALVMDLEQADSHVEGGVARSGVRVSQSVADGHQLQRRRMDRLRHAGQMGEERNEALQNVEVVRELKEKLSEAEMELKEAKRALQEQEYAHGALQVEYDDLVSQMARERALRLASDEALGALERREQSGSDSTLQQVRAVAKQHIEVLQRRLAERDQEVAAVKKNMDAMREQFKQQHDVKRREIERLNNALYDKNAKSIADIREDINRTAADPTRRWGGGGGSDDGEDDDDGDGGGGSPHGRKGRKYEQLQRLLDQREAQLEDIRNKLEQIKNHYSIAENHFRSEQAQKDHAIRELTVELQVYRQGKDGAAEREKEVRHLKSEVLSKGSKLSALKAALKDMEQKLMRAEQAHVNVDMKSSNYKEQEELDHRLARLDAEKKEVQMELAKVRNELARVREDASEDAKRYNGLADELKRTEEKLEDVQRDLNRERKKVRDLKHQRDVASEVNTTMQKPNPKVAGTLENRIKVLEAQNARMKNLLQSERGPIEVQAEMAVVDEEASRPRTSVPTRGRAEERPSSGRSAAPRTDYSGTDPKLKQWEENKRLKDRIQKLRDGLAGKNRTIDELSKERDRRAAQVGGLQEELKRAKDLLAEAQRTRQAATTARPGMSEPQRMRELVEEANKVMEERDELAREVAALRRRLGGGESGYGGGDEGGENRDVQMYELRLERDHALAQVARVKGQMDDLFAEAQAGRAGAASAVPRSAGGRKGASGTREAELEATVEALQRALDRSTREAKQSVPNTKYMALLDKKKALTKQLAALQGSAAGSERVQSEMKALELRCANLEESNAALRSQLRDSRGGGANTVSAQQSELTAQLRAVQAALQAKEMQVSNLQRQLHDVQSSGVGQAEVARLTQRLASVEAENEDLKTELNAFDPAFFEEIEDLKHEHHQLSVQCDTQRTVIRDLSRQLGIVPPLQ